MKIRKFPYHREHCKLKKNTFAGIHTIILDEISMIRSSTFTVIHQRLYAILGNENPFGNLFILFGDFFQLPPVRESKIFTDTVLWPSFHQYTLTINERQQKDLQYVNIMNNIRIGHVPDVNIQTLPILDYYRTFLTLMSTICSVFSRH